MMRGRVLVLSALVSMGCGASDRDELAETREPVAGISDDANDYPMVVGIATLKGQFISRCSGALIAQNLVLTARHCIAESISNFTACGQSPIGAAYPPANVKVTILPQQSDTPSDYL